MSPASMSSLSPPWFEDLEVGRVFGSAPAVTLTEGAGGPTPGTRR